VLVQVKNERERSSPVRPPGVEKTSRLRSRDPVASGVKCGPHGGMNSKMKSWTVLGRASKPRSSQKYVEANSLVEIGGGYTEFVGFEVVHQKTTELLGCATKPRPKTRRGGAATQAGSTAQEGRSDRLGRSDRRDRSNRHRGGSLTALVAGAEMLRSGGHASGSQGLRRG
jgi:hypothetical protein